MAKYIVEITEILQRQVVVDGKNIEDAERKVREQYKNEDIVLTSNDYCDTNFIVLKRK